MARGENYGRGSHRHTAIRALCDNLPDIAPVSRATDYPRSRQARAASAHSMHRWPATYLHVQRKGACWAGPICSAHRVGRLAHAKELRSSRQHTRSCGLLSAEGHGQAPGIALRTDSRWLLPWLRVDRAAPAQPIADERLRQLLSLTKDATSPPAWAPHWQQRQAHGAGHGTLLMPAPVPLSTAAEHEARASCKCSRTAGDWRIFCLAFCCK